MGLLDSLRLHRHSKTQDAGPSSTEQTFEKRKPVRAYSENGLNRPSFLRRTFSTSDRASSLCERNVTVLIDGLCKVKKNIFHSPTLYYCAIKEGCLCCYERANVTGQGYDGRPILKLKLTGTHLEAHGSLAFVLKTSDGSKYHFETDSERERDGWLFGLATAPGLYRRPKDYYITGELWGKGTTCKVLECFSKLDGRKYAMKTRLRHDHATSQVMHNELKILQLCAKHPHAGVMHLQDYFYDQDDHITLIVELLEGGELLGRIAGRHQFAESDARTVFKQIAEGVAHLHSLGIAHRDLKPQNLMYLNEHEDSPIKIVDFGYAKANFAPTWQGETPCGSLAYMAPEVVREERYSQAIDIWSLGVILYLLLCGELPFRGDTLDATRELIRTGTFDFSNQAWKSISAATKELIRRLLDPDPAKRLTAQQLLQSDWLNPTTDAIAGQASESLTTPTSLRLSISEQTRSSPSSSFTGAVSGSQRFKKIASGEKVHDMHGFAVHNAMNEQLEQLRAVAGVAPLPPAATNKRLHKIEMLKHTLEAQNGAGLKAQRYMELAGRSSPGSPSGSPMGGSKKMAVEMESMKSNKDSVHDTAAYSRDAGEEGGQAGRENSTTSLRMANSTSAPLLLAGEESE